MGDAMRTGMLALSDQLIVCRTHAGLCNRLKCLVSSQRIAQRTGRHLQLHWPANDRCGATFGDLFDTSFDEVSALPDAPIVDRYGFIEERSNAPTLILHTWRFALTQEEWTSGESTLDFQYGEELAQRSIARDIHRLLCGLRPIPEIAERVATVVATEFSSDVIGVHVRRGDHALAIAASPDAAFERLLRHQVAVRPRSRIFIASDCASVRERLARQFGDRVFYIKDATSDRGLASSIQTALVELLLLAKCHQLLGSQSSTFTEVAWWLGGWRPIQIALEIRGSRL